jgi:DNA-binding transcriptional LysR family regulator
VFVEHGVSRQLVVEAQLSRTIVSLVANGAGVALIDPVTAAYAGEHVVVKAFEPELWDQVYLASATIQQVSTISTEFASLARKALGQLVE